MPPGQPYSDPDPPPPEPEPEPVSYEVISNAIFDSYSALLSNPTSWASDLEDTGAKSSAEQFTAGSSITKNDQLTAISASFLKEAAPCSSYENAAGENMILYFVNQVESYEKAHLMSYIGDYTDNPKDVIVDQLNKGRFDTD